MVLRHSFRRLSLICFPATYHFAASSFSSLSSLLLLPARFPPAFHFSSSPLFLFSSLASSFSSSSSSIIFFSPSSSSLLLQVLYLFLLFAFLRFSPFSNFLLLRIFVCILHFPGKGRQVMYTSLPSCFFFAFISLSSLLRCFSSLFLALR